jgi:hypothetical protein
VELALILPFSHVTSNVGQRVQEITFFWMKPVDELALFKNNWYLFFIRAEYVNPKKNKRQRERKMDGWVVDRVLTVKLSRHPNQKGEDTGRLIDEVCQSMTNVSRLSTPKRKTALLHQPPTGRRMLGGGGRGSKEKGLVERTNCRKKGVLTSSSHRGKSGTRSGSNNNNQKRVLWLSGLH